MKRDPRPWTDQELALLGTRPEVDVADLTGRAFGTVWQKRRSLGIPQPPLRFRKWAPAEDKVVGTASDAEIACRFGRTESAIKSRRAILEKEWAKSETKPRISDPTPCLAVLEKLGVEPITVPRDPSLADDDRYRLVDGPYYPPRASRGRFLVCELRGIVKIGGYSDAPIPWPRIWHRRSLVICEDMLRALRTESVLAVSDYWGLSKAIVSHYRQLFSVPHVNPGTHRLIREFVIPAFCTAEAHAKQSAAREGKPSAESARGPERLRQIQSRPKPTLWRRKMSERLRRRFDVVGPYRKWTPEELAMIGTMPDREVARPVKAKKFLA
jgi:hypothetical protein